MPNDIISSHEKFSDKLRILEQHAENLLQQAERNGGEQKGFITEIFSELQVSLEELRVAEEELRQQNDELIISRQEVESERQRYRDLFEFAPDGYIVTDTAGMIQEANRAAGTLLGVLQRALVGKPLVIYFTQNYHAAFYNL